MSVRNYHSILRTIPEECRSHMIWDASISLALYSPVQSDPVQCFIRKFRIPRTKFQENSSSCIQVNMVISSVWERRHINYVPVTLSQHAICNHDESADSPGLKCFMIRDERKCCMLVVANLVGGNCVCTSPVNFPYPGHAHYP